MLGTTVLYTLTDNDVANVNSRREDNYSKSLYGQPLAAEEDTPLVFPLLVVEDNDGVVSGRVFVPENDGFYVRNISLGGGAGEYAPVE